MPVTTVARLMVACSYDGGMTHYQMPTAPPRVGWDIHCHTVFSDGTQTPENLVSEAVRRGLCGVGISDHDTSAGWHEAKRAAHEASLPLLCGTEITAVDGEVSVHVLGLQYDPNNAHITKLFDTTRAARLKRTQRMVQRLSEDYPISWQSVLAQVKEGERTTIGRPHIADALVAAGVYRTRGEAFAGVVSASSKYYIPTPSPSTREVVRAVSEAGGVSIIAHAGDASRNRRLLSDERIAALVDDGLAGLEVWHRGNSPEQRTRLLGLARHFGLLVTGGSDWHGEGKPNELGENLTDEATVEEIVCRGALPLG